MKRYIKSSKELSLFLNKLTKFIKQEAKQYGAAEVEIDGSVLTVTLYSSPDKVGTNNFISQISEDFSDESQEFMEDLSYLENTAYAIIDDLANNNSGEITKGPDW